MHEVIYISIDELLMFIQQVSVVLLGVALVKKLSFPKSAARAFVYFNTLK